MTIPRNINPTTQLARIIRNMSTEEAQGALLRSTGRIARVTSIEPMKILLDGFDITLSYVDGDFIVSDHLNLELDDSVIAIPILSGRKYVIIARFSQEYPIENNDIGDNYADTFVGFRTFVDSTDRTNRTTTIFAKTWALLRGSVGGTLKVLTHIEHHHIFTASNPVTTSSDDGTGPGNHSHTVTIPNTDTPAINPEV